MRLRTCRNHVSQESAGVHEAGEKGAVMYPRKTLGYMRLEKKGQSCIPGRLWST